MSQLPKKEFQPFSKPKPHQVSSHIFQVKKINPNDNSGQYINKDPSESSSFKGKCPNPACPYHFTSNESLQNLDSSSYNNLPNFSHHQPEEKLSSTYKGRQKYQPDMQPEFDEPKDYQNQISYEKNSELLSKCQTYSHSKPQPYFSKAQSNDEYSTHQITKEYRLKVTKDLEKALIELAKLKKKVFCNECMRCPIEFIKVPCGHGYCNECNRQDFCSRCEKNSNEYMVSKY